MIAEKELLILEKMNRICAFCLTNIPGKDVRKCSACHHRAYCGVDCQKKDWKSKIGDSYSGRKGQGHKFWCILECGEEGIDFEVRKNEDRGKGIFAITKIPAGKRIIVDGFGSKEVLAPQALSTLGRSVLINHSCNSNADRVPDPELRVMIVYAKQDIESGEEITVNYLDLQNYCTSVPNPFPSLYGKALISNFEDTRIILERKYKIICQKDCFCRRAENEEMLADLQTCHKSLFSDQHSMIKAMTGSSIDEEEEEPEELDPEAKLKIVDKMLNDLMPKMNSGLLGKAIILQKGFDIAVSNQGMRQKAVEYGRECCEAWATFFHPLSGIVQQAKEQVENLI